MPYLTPTVSNEKFAMPSNYQIVSVCPGNRRVQHTNARNINPSSNPQRQLILNLAASLSAMVTAATPYISQQEISMRGAKAD
jgi:hypothetical protein